MNNNRNNDTKKKEKIYVLLIVRLRSSEGSVKFGIMIPRVWQLDRASRYNETVANIWENLIIKQRKQYYASKHTKPVDMMLVF